MAYTDFTIETIDSELGITVERVNLFPDLHPVNLPGWLADNLARWFHMPLISEKARSEFIVTPVLLTLCELADFQVTILSGQRLDVDADRRLVGECDFILTPTDALPRLRAPLLTIVEAKRNDIEAGLGQCIAQMVAAQIFNDRAGLTNRALYGCVTTGEVWQFLRLHAKIIEVDQRRFSINEVGEILAALLRTVRFEAHTHEMV